MLAKIVRRACGRVDVCGGLGLPVPGSWAAHRHECWTSELFERCHGGTDPCHWPTRPRLLPPGNLLFGGLPLLPLPALLVNLSRTGLGGPLVDAFGATQQSPTSPFPFALVVDLSGNVLSSPLPSGFSRSSSWGALLDTAVFIDLSGKGHQGSAHHRWPLWSVGVHVCCGGASP